MPNPLSRNPRDGILFGPNLLPAPSGWYLIGQATLQGYQVWANNSDLISASAFFSYIDANPDYTHNYTYLGRDRVNISNRHLGYISTRWTPESYRVGTQDPRLYPLTLLRPRVHAHLHYSRSRTLLYLT
jgi:hypothetical protein